MNTIYKLLQEDEISEITYFIKQKQLSPHTYLNGIGPTITLPLLRYMLFNNLVYVYGSYIMFTEQSKQPYGARHSGPFVVK